MYWKDIVSIAGGGGVDDVKAWLLPQKADTVHSMIKVVLYSKDKRTRELIDGITPDRIKDMDEEVLHKLVTSMDAGLVRLLEKVIGDPKRMAALIEALPETLLERFPRSVWMSLSDKVRKELPPDLVDKVNNQVSVWAKFVRTHAAALLFFAGIVGVSSLGSFFFTKSVLGIRTPSMLSKPPTMFDELGQPIDAEDTPDDLLTKAGVTDPAVAEELKKEFFNESINKYNLFVYWGIQTVLGFVLLRVLMYNYASSVRWMPHWITFKTMMWIFLAYQAVFLVYIMVFLYNQYVDDSIGTMLRGFGDNATYKETRIPKERFYFYMLMSSQFHVTMLVSLLVLPLVQWGRDWLHGKGKGPSVVDDGDGDDDDGDDDGDDDELSKPKQQKKAFKLAQSVLGEKGMREATNGFMKDNVSDAAQIFGEKDLSAHVSPKDKEAMKQAANLAQSVLGDTGMKAATNLAKRFMGDKDFEQAANFAEGELGMDVKKLMKGGRRKKRLQK